MQTPSRMANNVHMSGLLSRHDDEATRTSTSEGLEEGEVEGETLLIVESEDQASVDLSHDQSGDSLNSDEGDVSWMEEMSYYCEKCQKWIPASKPDSCVVFCLHHWGGCLQGSYAVLHTCLMGHPLFSCVPSYVGGERMSRHCVEPSSLMPAVCVRDFGP